MPSKPVYAIDFKHGNLTPSLDLRGWGAMKLGNSGPAANPTSAGDAQGLDLTVTADGSGPAAIGAYVVLDDGDLSLESRLLLRVEFDRPRGIPPAPPVTGTPEPWAVALNVKFGNESFVPNEPMVPVTCQFDRNLGGARLNTPRHLERDQAAILLSHLDYDAMTPAVFTLEHHFCGVKAEGRYAIGHGALDIGPPIKSNDQRVYSNNGLSGGEQSSIGALGATLVTQTGTGTIKVRLRTFAISLWP